MVWDTKDQKHTQYQTTQDVIQDEQLIKSFKKQINNEMNEKEIRNFITKYCHDEFQKEEEIDISIDEDESKDDDDKYHQIDPQEEYIDFRQHKLSYINNL